ncbi:MAG: FtsQ-type POTRA domain-containing protein [Treponema sp.]|nr:FtsQ-type POTRA domain-containing protein [Treponema sp.]
MSDMSMTGFASGMVEKKRDVKTRIIIVVFSVLCVVFFAEIVIYKFVLPSMGKPKIIFSGSKEISMDEMTQLLYPMRNMNWFAFNAEEAVSILASIPAVDAVSVSKHFPDKIFINIVERESVAMTFISVNGRSIPVQIDRNGVLFNDPSMKQNGSIIPIISGMPVEHLSEGMRIPVKYRMLIEQVAAIQKLGQKYFAAIAEICVVPKEYGNYELMLIPAKTKIRVLTDRALNEDALQYMMVVLDVVNSIEPNVAEVDLRYGSVSYRAR